MLIWFISKILQIIGQIATVVVYGFCHFFKPSSSNLEWQCEERLFLCVVKWIHLKYVQYWKRNDHQFSWRSNNLCTWFYGETNVLWHLDIVLTIIIHQLWTQRLWHNSMLILWYLVNWMKLLYDYCMVFKLIIILNNQ